MATRAGDNRENCLAAIQLDGWNLKFAPEALRADSAFVLAAILQDSSAVQFASDGLRRNTEWLKRAYDQSSPGSDAWVKLKMAIIFHEENPL